MRDVVIAGAGMAGLHAAESLRAAGFTGRITLLGDEQHRPYSRPPLSKELLTGAGAEVGADTPAAAQLRTDEEFAALDLDLRPGARAARLLPGEQAVELADGSRVRGDAVIVATGAAARRPDTDLDGVHVLRTLEDAAAVRAGFDAAAAAGGRIAVVGAGFIGAEVAASARARGLDTVLVEAAETPLLRSVDPRVGSVLTDLHRDNGVEVRLGAPVAAFEGAGRLKRLRLADGTAIDADLAVCGLGVELNTGWLAGSGVRLTADGGVATDAYGRTSVPGVYAAGDLAEFPHPHPHYGGRLRLEHWTNAGEQAEAAARNLLAGEGGEPYAPVPYFWSDQYGRKIQLLGRAAPADTVEFVHGAPEDRKFVAFLGRDGMLTGVLGLKSTPKVMRYRRLLAEPTTWDEALAAARG
ncbi:NAD(P)/FAD-dependent oxidoreductase [Nocardiopsis coralliicola]